MSGDLTSRSLLEKVIQCKEAIQDSQRSEAVALRRKQQLLTARERLDALVDQGSFREIGALVDPDRSHASLDALKAPADGIVTGNAMIDGHEVCVVAQDYTVLGGSIGPVADRKMCRMVDRSADRGIPLVMLLEGGGHRIQDGMNTAHFAAASPIFSRLGRLSGWVPNIVAVMGQGFAAPTAYAALADFVVMLKGKSTMGIAGPALVKAGTGSDVSKEALGGEKRQVEQQGIADLAADSEEECFEAIKRYLSYFPKNANESIPVMSCDDPTDRRDDVLLDLVTANSRKVYDMRKVIAVIADKDSVFEKKPSYAQNIITCLARLGGRPVGFVANQPLRKGGILDVPACEKAAHFIALCDAFGIPLVSLIDIPGIAIGEAAEDTGIGRRSGRLFYEMALATVPFVSVVLRKGYGGGYYAMGGGRGFNADACFAWPTAEICAMSIEGAVDVAYKKKYLATIDPEAARQAMIDEIKGQTSAIHAARDFGIDDVIDPRDTRRLLIETFNSCAPRRPDRSPPRRRSISPI